MEIGTINFERQIDHDLFLEFSNGELKIFQNDLLGVIKSISPIMQKENNYIGRNIANQRIGRRKFRLEFITDFTPEQEKIILIEKLDELTTDEYLDSIEECNHLDSGYRRINTK